MPRVKAKKTSRWTYDSHLCRLKIDGVCYYPEYCRFWKKCHSEGTVFFHGWGKKMLTLLELKRSPSKPTKLTKPKKDGKLDQFFETDKKAD